MRKKTCTRHPINGVKISRAGEGILKLDVLADRHFLDACVDENDARVGLLARDLRG